MNLPTGVSVTVNITIAVVCWRPSRELGSVLAAIVNQVPAEIPVILFLSGRTSDGELAQRGVTSHLEQVRIHRPDSPMSIGEARSYIARVVETEFVVFLDDDCVPMPNWYRALVDTIKLAPSVGLIFGPRYEYQASGVGALVRAVEARRSRKNHLSHPRSLRMDDANRYLPFCAGGNMVVNLKCAKLSGGITAPEFVHASFEDVDLQLRLMKKEFQVLFVPTLAVVHSHPLGFWPLLQKSWRSGRGSAVMKRKHGNAFVLKSRWVRKRDLFAPTILSIANLRCAYQLCGMSGALTWLAVKPIRNAVIWLSLLMTEFSLAYL